MDPLPPLSAPRAADVLRFLDVPAPRRDRDWLDTLLQQYGRRVPWESASRIAPTATLPMDTRTTPWFRYDISRVADRRYRLGNHLHPMPYLFDLRDEAERTSVALHEPRTPVRDA